MPGTEPSAPDPASPAGGGAGGAVPGRAAPGSTPGRAVPEEGGPNGEVNRTAHHAPHRTASPELLRELRAAVTAPGRVDDSGGRRALYAYDASNYRQVPAAVVLPATAAELAGAVAACRRHGMPVTMRGAGTSIAGQALGAGVVIDTSAYFNRILRVDPEARTAVVEPGLVLDRLQDVCRPHGLHFGPDPSTHSRATIGGMIGNNSCGTHSPAWGTTADNVLELEVLTYTGARLRIGRGDPELLPPLLLPDSPSPDTPDAATLGAAVRNLSNRHLSLLRTELGRFPRQISGIGLHHLLPENGRNLAAALTGTEGTCVIVLSATLRLVELPTSRELLVLGFADLPAAGDAVTAVLPHRPLACEGLGGEQVAALRRQVPDAAPERVLPAGNAWLLCEFDTSASPSASPSATVTTPTTTRTAPDPEALRAATGATAVRTVTDPAEQRTLFRIREESSGLATRAPDGSEAWPGWEDAAVPPENLGDYLRDFLRLLDRHGLHGTPYGHFGEGCVHVRIDFDLAAPDGAAAFRAFLTEAARLVAAHGGTLSGEHGDGRARAELLPLVYSAEAIAAFTAFKDLWDPEGGLNPGILIRPRPLDADLRVGPLLPVLTPADTAFGYPEDGGDMARALRRCVGVGKCRSESGGVMCPSWRATHDEQHSTRGRARLLDEMLRGATGTSTAGDTNTPITEGWRSTEVRDALDLCLSCKGCSADCPVGVDMATYKAEFLHQHYRHRLRPAAHYSMGRLPLWAHAARRAPGGARAANAAMRNPLTTRLLKAAGGIAPERALPQLAPRTFRDWFNGRPTAPIPGGSPVLFWPDTFTEHFAPEIGRAAVEVLEHAGFSPALPPAAAPSSSRPLCCGLTWISTGQLTAAARHLTRALDALEPALRAGVPVLVLEPSCAAVFRSDAAELLPDDPRAALAADGGVLTLAELLDSRAPDTDLGRLPEAAARTLTQTHCHQHAVLGTAADERVLQRIGAANDRLDSGCCGLAGNFGFEAGHHDISVKIAEQSLMPALRAASPDTTLLADGFSCRTQVTQLSERSPEHLAQLLHRAIQHSTAPQNDKTARPDDN